jgi:hypothetical protein
MPEGMPVSRGRAVVAGTVTLLIILGCMSFEGSHVDRVEHVVSLPSSPAESPDPNLVADGELRQNGMTKIGAESEQDVYYPVPYLTPPYLELSLMRDNIKLIEQRRDHFRVKNIASDEKTIVWEAKGTRALLKPVSVVAAPQEAPPPKKLPAEPEPVLTPP